MKTIELWLQELPEPERSQALANMWWEDAHTLQHSLPDALRQAFNWSKSPEKYKYWHNIHARLIGNDPLP